MALPWAPQKGNTATSPNDFASAAFHATKTWCQSKTSPVPQKKPWPHSVTHPTLDDVRLAGAAADRSGGAGSSGLSRPDILGSSCNRVGIVQLTISNWIVQNIDDVEEKNYLNVLSDSASWKSVGQSLGSVKFSAARSGCTTITNRNGEIARKKSCFG